MGRPAKFSEDDFLDAALQLVSEGGPDAVSMARVADRLHAPTGSLYHRFASRDLLLGHLWLRTVTDFQAGFLAALADPDLDVAAVGAARHVVSWSREHLAEARVLLLYRREDLSTRWPEDLAPRLAGLNADVEGAVRDHALRRWPGADAVAVSRATLALVDLPYAAGRRHLLAGRPPPEHLDELVATACLDLLTDGPAPRASS